MMMKMMRLLAQSEWPSNNSMQRTALRAAADAERWLAIPSAMRGIIRVWKALSLRAKNHLLNTLEIKKYQLFSGNKCSRGLFLTSTSLK